MNLHDRKVITAALKMFAVLGWGVQASVKDDSHNASKGTGLCLFFSRPVIAVTEYVRQ